MVAQSPVLHNNDVARSHMCCCRLEEASGCSRSFESPPVVRLGILKLLFQENPNDRLRHSHNGSFDKCYVSILRHTVTAHETSNDTRSHPTANKICLCAVLLKVTRPALLPDQAGRKAWGASRSSPRPGVGLSIFKQLFETFKLAPCIYFVSFYNWSSSINKALALHLRIICCLKIDTCHQNSLPVRSFSYQLDPTMADQPTITHATREGKHSQTIVQVQII